MTRFYLILLSGIFWLFVGFGLLMKGLKLLTIFSIDGGEERALFYLSIALLLGWIKGRWVLSKSAKRMVHTILSLPEPIAFTRVYGRNYIILIGGMVSLGFLLRWLQLAPLIKGPIDVTIGSALIFGSFIYFRTLLFLRQGKV